MMRPRRRSRTAAAGTDLDPSQFAEPLVVTALSPHPRHESRALVTVNGVDVGALPIDLLGALALRAGRDVTRGQLRDLLIAVRRTALLDRALDLLAVRGRSTRDLRVRLRRLDAGDGDIAWVTDRLTTQGYLDDAAYARQLARAKMLGAGLSRRRMVTELRRRGIAPDVAADAIERTLADVELDEHGAALEAARKRMRALASADPATRRRRLYAFLARRGYETETVHRVLREVLEGRTGDD